MTLLYDLSELNRLGAPVPMYSVSEYPFTRVPQSPTVVQACRMLMSAPCTLPSPSHRHLVRFFTDLHIVHLMYQVSHLPYE